MPQAVTHSPIRQEYAYYLDKNLTGLTVRSGDTLLSQTSYAYDGNEVVRLIRPNEYGAQTDSGDGSQFIYDAQGRVLTVVGPNGHVLQTKTQGIPAGCLYVKKCGPAVRTHIFWICIETGKGLGCWTKGSALCLPSPSLCAL